MSSATANERSNGVVFMQINDDGPEPAIARLISAIRFGRSSSFWLSGAGEPSSQHTMVSRRREWCCGTPVIRCR